MVLLPNDEDVANSSKKRTQFKTRVHKPYPISDKMVDSTKTAKKKIPFGAAHTYITYMRDYPAPPPPTHTHTPPTGAKNALQIMSLAAYASGTNKLTPVLFLTLSLRYNILSDLN